MGGPGWALCPRDWRLEWPGESQSYHSRKSVLRARPRLLKGATFAYELLAISKGRLAGSMERFTIDDDEDFFGFRQGVPSRGHARERNGNNLWLWI